MRKNFVFIGLLILLILIESLSSTAQTKFNSKGIDSLLNYFFTNNKMMGSITIAKNDKIQYNHSFGYTEITDQLKLPSDSKTKYRIGSITKMFTSVMIFQLIEEKKLNLNTPLAKFFPAISNANKITIADLLDHHSGLHNFTNDNSYHEWETKPKTEKEMLELFGHEKSDFQPGEKAEYSNTNYVLLGYIIEKITGDTYSNELRKRILDKIHLKNTYYGHKINPQNDEAFSYSFKDGLWREEPETDMSIPGGAGSIVSTPEDLIKFINALFQGKLIDKKSLNKMMTLKDNIGMGIFRFPFNKRYAFGHTGGIDGFASFLAYFPDDSTSIAFCSNGINYEFNDILIGALSLYYNIPYRFPDFKTINMPVKKLMKFEGIYSSSALPLVITIKLQGNVLTAQATNQSSFDLTPIRENEFTFDPAGITITFIKSKEGQYNDFNLKQGGGTFLYRRQK